MVKTGNIRMLSVYYSAQSLFKNDLSAPLLSAVRPLINVQEHSLSLLIEKLLPNLKCRVEFKRMQKRVGKNFSKIDSGRIKPTAFVGHRLKTDEIVENALKHDTYSAIYKEFFRELLVLCNESVDGIRDEFVAKVMHGQLKLSEREKIVMQNAICNFEKRPPISLGLDEMKDLVDVMHNCVSTSCGSIVADAALATAVLHAEKVAPDFSAQQFI